MNLRKLDLNLLIIFSEMLKSAKVSIVAENLNLSQPTVSHALNRLREYFDDDLFIRTARGMEPTHYAKEISKPILAALHNIEMAISNQIIFDPKTSVRNFKVAMTDIGEIYFLPELSKILQLNAPNITLSTVRNTSTKLKEEMEIGNIDIAIGLIPDLRTGFLQKVLFKQKYVCLFRKNHYLDKKILKISDFLKVEHINIISAGTGHDKVGRFLAQAGVERRIKMQLPHFVSVGHILQTTDLVATVPEKLAQCITEQFNLTYKLYPVNIPDISVKLFWHRKYHKDPGNQWLRSAIYKKFSE